MPDTYTFDTTCPASGPTAYTASATTIPDADLTQGTGKLYEYYPGGLIASTYTSYFDIETTKDWTKSDGANGYLRQLTGTSKDLLMLNNSGTVTGTVEEAQNILQSGSGSQRTKDEQFKTRLREEYCHYKQRYQVLLTAFLNAVKPGSSTTKERQQLLITALKEVNSRMNALTLLVKYIGEVRIAYVDAYKTMLNSTNSELDQAIASLSPTASLLDQNNAIAHTRKEMVRYTKEKNNAITNQISLWASLNVVAIAIIFHLYRTM